MANTYARYNGLAGSGGGSSAGVSSLNTLTGAITLLAGTNITLSTVGNNITINSSGSGGGITSINADTTAAQTLVTATTGTNFTISTTSGVTTFALPTASASNRGALSSADWTTFNGKQNTLTLGNLTSTPTTNLVVTGGTGAVVGSGALLTLTGASLVEATSSVLTITGATNAVLGTGVSIQVKQASTSQSGYLSSTDWNTFNGKQSAITLTTTGTSGAATFIANTLNIPQYAGTGTVTSVALTAPAFLSVAGSPVTSSGTLTLSYSGTALPIINGGTGVTAVTTSPAATSFAGWDANKNLSANSFIPGYATTATAAGTTTLTVSSAEQQYFTGTTTQTIILPVASTLVLGQQFIISNLSTGILTINSSGGNLVGVLSGISGNTTPTAICTVILASGTTAASWSVQYSVGSGSGAAPQVTVLTSGSTYAVPAGALYLQIQMCGGGGGGAGSSNLAAGGGGGGGGTVFALINNPATSYSYSVGSGGSSGVNGNNTTFSTFTAGGGTAGTGTSSAATGGTGGAGGTASGGYLNVPGGGGNGGNFGVSALTSGSPGSGGSSLLGLGGAATPAAPSPATPNAGGIYGSGGSGGGNGQTGAPGAAGVIIVTAHFPAGGASGTVTSVAMTVPSDETVTGSPVTSSGTLAITRNSQSANLVLASPNGSSGVPAYRALVGADVPSLATASIGITIDGAGSVITTGSKGFIHVEYACTIVGNTILADQSGSCVLAISAGTYGAFPTNSSIVASAPPTLTSAQSSQDNTLTGWTTSVAAGTVLQFSVTSATTVTRINFNLKVTRT